MNKNIDFLIVKNREKVKKKKGVNRLRIAAIFSLIVIGLLSVLAYDLNRRIYPQELKTERDSLIKSLSTLRSREAKLAVVTNRAENISELINKRVDYSKIIGKFFEKMPAQIKVDSLRIDEKKLILSISSNSLLAIDELIDSLIDLGKNKYISVLLLDSLAVNEASGSYAVSLTSSL